MAWPLRDYLLDLAGGGVQGPQLQKALLLGHQGRLEGVGKLGVVHGHDPEASFQLDDLHFGPRELEIDCFSHSLPSYVRLIVTAEPNNYPASPQVMPETLEVAGT